MNFNVTNNYNNTAKANFGNLNGFGQSLLNKATSALFAEPPTAQTLVVSLANGDRLVIFDIPENQLLPAQATKNTKSTASQAKVFDLVA